MPGKGSAAKRNRQNAVRRNSNRMTRSAVRTAQKKFFAAVDSKNRDNAETEFNSVIKLLDTAGGKGIYHKNTAARKKSRMHKLLNSMSAE